MHIWKAYLDDGSIVTEGSDVYPSSEDLPKDRVARMEYVPLDNSSKPVGLDIDLKNGERFFRFWRKWASATYGLEPVDVYSEVCVMGVQKDGKKIISVYVYPDNTVVVSTNHEL